MHHTNFSSQLGRILMNSRLYHLVVSGFNTDISNHQTRCQGENSCNCFEVKFCNNLQIFCQFCSVQTLLQALSLSWARSLNWLLVKVCPVLTESGVTSATSDCWPGLPGTGQTWASIFTWKSTLHPDNLRHPSSHRVQWPHHSSSYRYHNICWHHCT